MSTTTPTIEDARQFLAKHRKGVLSTVTPENHAQAAMMLYVLGENFVTYWGTKKSFRKYANLQSNPHVAVTVLEATPDPLSALQLEGTVEFVPQDEMEHVYMLFDTHNPSKFFVRGAEDLVFFRVVPSWIRHMDGSSGALLSAEFTSPF
jgi:general stress protein 26